MIPELNLPINFAGKDGFYWWIGQIEPKTDPKQGTIENRYKVRIVGQHVKSCDAITPEDLPWAVVMMPVTNPIHEGNDSFTTVDLKEGDWVIGFFLDGAEGQHPVIMGQLPRSTNVSKTKGPTSNIEDSCLAFERRMKISNPKLQIPTPNTNTGSPGEPDPKNGDQKPAGTSGTSPLARCGNGENSENRMCGRDTCIQVADIPCKTDSGQGQSRIQTFLSELLLNIQTSGGNFGNKILSSYSGTLMDYGQAAQSYVNKIFGVARSWINSAKGQALSLIKKGIASLLQSVFGTSVDPATGKKTKVGMFATITKFLNDQLGLVNCAIADLEDRILDFLFNLITNFIIDALSAATCAIESAISSILDQILSFLNDAFLAILGPLSAILGIIASPLNILGAALQFVLNLLGITCTGPGDCRDASTSKYCTGKSNKTPFQSENAALDALIAQAENANTEGAQLQTTCTEYLAVACENETQADVVGGQPDPNEYSDETDAPPTDDTADTFMDSFLAGILASTPSNNTSESGTSATFTVRLRSLPTSDVTVAVTSQSPSEGTVSPSSLTFTTSNWYTEQTVTVTGVDDSFFDGDVTYTVRLLASSSDVNYNNFPEFVDIVNTDNEAEIGNLFVDIDLSGSLRFIASSSLYTLLTPIVTQESNSVGSLSASGISTVDFVPNPSAISPNITYTLTSDKTSVLEGESITFTLTATDGIVPDGTQFDYIMFGMIQSTDFTDGTNIGTMTMQNNVAVKSIGISNTSSVKIAEDVTFNVVSQSKLFTIISKNPITPEPTPTTIPTFKAPVLGTPEVGPDGGIIDIPIIEKGDPYIIPPMVKIYGVGVGGFATPVLDSQGFITKIKVERPGQGYLPNRKNGNCVIDGFNLIRPGGGYETEPKVYIDGDPNIAKPIMRNGSVVGLNIIDKTKTFNQYPKVRVVGDGAGAIIMPTFKCFNTPTYQEYITNVAPSGADSVIDCP